MDHDTWRKSRHSDDKGGACVEVAGQGGTTAIRDSKDPDGPRLVLTAYEFRVLLMRLRRTDHGGAG